MIYDVSADLTYRFAEPCEVLLLIEAADAPGQSVLSEALSIAPRAHGDGFSRPTGPA